MKWAVVCAAFMSVFGFSSCLDDGGESTPIPGYVVGRFELGVSGYEFVPDFFDVVYETGVYDLTPYGFSSFTSGRAVMCFTVPEGTEITEDTKRIKIKLETGGWALPSKRIVEDPESYTDYTSKIVGFYNPAIYYSTLSVSPAWVKDHVLNLCFGYEGDDKTEYVLCPDRMSTVTQDTLYLDLKMKTSSTSTKIMALDTYSLVPVMDEIMKLQPKDDKDSIFLAISAKGVEYGAERTVTTVAKTVKREAMY